MGMIPNRLYGIVGYPVGHSLSPLMHNTAFVDLNIPAVFMAWEIEASRLPLFVDAVRTLGIRGCSVTIPHKIALIPLLDDVTERVRIMGAANTLFWRDGKLCGENTDVLGFVAPLKALGPGADTEALVLGAGGAARAAVAGLQSLGVKKISISSRTFARAEELASAFGITAIPWEDRCRSTDILVNATPLGMRGKLEGETPFPASAFAGHGVAYDIVYTPFRTRFLQEAEAAGWRTISGLEMFLGQGEAQFALWTGQQLTENARQAVIAKLSGQAA